MKVVMRRAVRDRLLSALPAPIPTRRTWGMPSSVAHNSCPCAGGNPGHRGRAAARRALRDHSA